MQRIKLGHLGLFGGFLSVFPNIHCFSHHVIIQVIFFVSKSSKTKYPELVGCRLQGNTVYDIINVPVPNNNNNNNNNGFIKTGVAANAELVQLDTCKIQDTKRS